MKERDGKVLVVNAIATSEREMRGSAGSKVAESLRARVSDLGKQIQGLAGDLSAVLDSDGVETERGLQISTVELTLAITLEGKVALVGSGSAEGAIKVVLSRQTAG